jgi:hypothetical protein
LTPLKVTEGVITMTAHPKNIDLSAFTAEHLQRIESDLLRNLLRRWSRRWSRGSSTAVCRRLCSKDVYPRRHRRAAQPRGRARADMITVATALGTRPPSPEVSVDQAPTELRFPSSSRTRSPPALQAGLSIVRHRAVRDSAVHERCRRTGHKPHEELRRCQASRGQRARGNCPQTRRPLTTAAVQG